jgi:hypothetical protein
MNYFSAHAFAPGIFKRNYFQFYLISLSRFIHDDVIICVYVTTPYDKLRVTGHGEPVEPCSWYSLDNDSHAQLFMTLCLVNPTVVFIMPSIEMPPGFSNCALKKDKSSIRCRETINLASSIFLKKYLFVERGNSSAYAGDHACVL